MGILDLPAPLLDALDVLLASLLSARYRIVVWGLLGGGITMALFALIASRGALARLKARVKQRRRELLQANGTFQETLALSGHMLKDALTHFVLTLAPTALSVIPLLTLLVWLDSNYSYRAPKPGQRLELAVAPKGAELCLAERRCLEPGTASRRTIAWPQAGGTIVLTDQAGTVVLRLPTEKTLPYAHKRRWWNIILANPNGYIPESARVNEIEIDFALKQYISVGPDWMRSWLALFALASAISALVAARFVFKVDLL